MKDRDDRGDDKVQLACGGMQAIRLTRNLHIGSFFTVISSILLAMSLRGEVFTGENSNNQFTIHGRLSCYNGGSNLRIWIVGSKRMLYIAGDNTPALERINKFFGDGAGWFSRDIYADFTVEPLLPDTKGHMRPVRVLAVKHVVVTKDGKVVSKREDL